MTDQQRFDQQVEARKQAERASRARERRRVVAVILGAVVIAVIVTVASSGDRNTGGTGEARTGTPTARTATPTATPVAATPSTWEGKLAQIQGDSGSEAEFGRILDQIQEGGELCAPEPNRQRVSDLIVASWQRGGSEGSLLDWARNLADACG